jgi:hypothetical protein
MKSSMIHIPLTNSYLSDRIEKHEMGGACGTYRIRRDARKLLMMRPEVKRQIGRPRPRWDDNINGSSGSGMEGVYWINLAQDRDRRRALVHTVLNFLVP